VFNLKSNPKVKFNQKWRSELSDYVTAIAWSPDGKTLATSSAAGEVVIYRGPSFEAFILQPIQGHSIDCCVFSHDGHFLAAGGQTGQIKVWRIQPTETTLVATLPDIVDWVDRMAWSPTDNLLAFSRGKVCGDRLLGQVPVDPEIESFDYGLLDPETTVQVDLIWSALVEKSKLAARSIAQLATAGPYTKSRN
jgi:WD domain, G-beta repeat/WD40-like Beta Propeller Repeat